MCFERSLLLDLIPRDNIDLKSRQIILGQNDKKCVRESHFALAVSIWSLRVLKNAEKNCQFLLNADVEFVEIMPVTLFCYCHGMNCF